MRRTGLRCLQALYFVIFAFSYHGQAAAQSADLTLNAQELVVGAKLTAHFAIEERENPPNYAIGLRHRNAKDYYWTTNVSPGETSSLNLPSPENPGAYEAVLFDSNKEIYAVVSFDMVVTPTPGALRTDKSDYIGGEKISVFLRKEENRYYGNGWIGIFKQGRHSEGGASIADERIDYQRFPESGKAAIFTAPLHPGTYEFRLFDRDGWQYILDRTAVKVTIPPTPGVMSLEKKIFVVGEPLSLSVQLQKDRQYGNAWIGLYRSKREAPGGGRMAGNRLTYQRVNTNTERLKFTTPSSPGNYHFRLYDRDSGYYGLDNLSFEVVVPPTPGVMSLEKEIFTIGEPLKLNVQLETGRHYGNAWIGLYKAASEAPGGALIEGSRITYQRINLKTELLNFTTPSSPGRYEFKLYDRDSGHYQLDQIAFNVEVPPTPGVMKLAEPSFVVGTPVVLSVKLEPNRHYGNAWIGLYRKEREASGGGKVDRHRLTYQRVNPKTEQLTFTAPGGPGTYEFRLYDRDSNHYLLDKLDFKVTVPQTPDVLSLDKEQYVTGEPLRLAVKLQAGRHYGNAWVGLFRKTRYNEDGARTDGARVTYQRASLKTTELVWTTPIDPGAYEFRLYDRDSRHFQLAAAPFTVVATASPGILRLQKSTYRPKEQVRVKIRLPKDRHRGNSWVQLARSGLSVNGGALAGEYSSRSFKVDEKTPGLSFEAPDEAGPWELRYYDRGSARYILEIKTFTVRGDRATGLKHEPVRFTPLPGGPSVALAPGRDSNGGSSGDSSGDGGEGLPGDPVKPNGGPAVKSDPTDTAENVGDNSENSEGDDPTNSSTDKKDQPDDDASATRPSLRFVAISAGGLSGADSLASGQAFIIEARYEQVPQEASVTAQLSYGDGTQQAVTLHRTNKDGLYRSGVIRLPAGGE